MPRPTRTTVALIPLGFLLGICFPLARSVHAQSFDCLRGGSGCGAVLPRDAGVIDPGGLTRSEVLAVQDALIWTGFYNGLKDGGWGAGTKNAIRDWRRANGLAPDGGSSRDDLQRLLSQATAARGAVGWRTVTDGQTGATMGYPARFVAPRPVQDGTDYGGDAGVDIKVRRYRTSLDGIRTSLASMARAPDVVAVNYRFDRPNRQVVSYDVASHATVYVRADRVGEDWVGFVIRVQQAPAYDRMIGAMSADFDAAGGTATRPLPSDMPTLGPLMAQAAAARSDPAPDTATPRAAEREPPPKRPSDEPVPRQQAGPAASPPARAARPDTALVGAFSSRDIASIVETSRGNEIRFARDFKGKSFGADGAFKSASESLLGGGYTVMVDTDGGSVLCELSDPALLNAAVEWNRGQSVSVSGSIRTTTIGALVLDKGCRVTAR